MGQGRAELVIAGCTGPADRPLYPNGPGNAPAGCTHRKERARARRQIEPRSHRYFVDTTAIRVPISISHSPSWRIARTNASWKWQNIRRRQRRGRLSATDAPFVYCRKNEETSKPRARPRIAARSFGVG